MNVIEWTKKARKQLAPIPRQEVEHIIAAVESLVNWPNVQNVKSLSDRDDYRLRVGRYRVFFSVTPSGKATVMLIEEIKKRDERTY
ncbi:MAG: type II toxin-antitoxin system RelE/ParE family toxin [Desulfovibrio sp.]|jgi:mRNA-degrading endonuclease RelE of RelBE toxin-antitoxin system|nr:type II toxin-antitoxin system RelE/ParE family toxin [Desulfovibrio sp.]